MTPISPLIPSSSVSTSSNARSQEPIREAAKALEAQFLAEMLKSAGFGEARSVFGGGAGEAAFSDFLVSQHAKSITQTGGIGLAEAIVSALVSKEGDHA